jgi:hypothetical protein
MEVSGGEQPGPRGDSENGPGETVEFGGLPFRWPLGERLLRRLPRMPRLPAPRGVVFRTAAISLGVGLLIGLGIGYFAIGPTGEKARRIEPQLITTAIETTGARCAVVSGMNLQLGVQLMNDSDKQVTLGRISTLFPMGGLRAISGGIGTCGVLLPNLVPPNPLPPRSTQWIVATVAMHTACPQPYPVWFKVSYSVGDTKSNVVIAAFPDLGQVHFGQCTTALVQSAFTFGR